MQLFNIIAILITLSALFAYINHRFIGLPSKTGIMLISLAVSTALIFMGHWGIGIKRQGVFLVSNIDFNEALMVGMLGSLLFAGALHVDVNDLLEHKWKIGIFSTIGVILSTLLIGTLMYFALGWLGISVRYIYCLLFGAIISPTDPISVLGILREAGAPKSLQVNITGESLFNDGIGVVVFIILLGIAKGEHQPSLGEVSLLFAEEAAGGFAFGLLLGWCAYVILKSMDNYQVEILVTLALVTGGYALALAMHMSGPIAMVVAGLLIGNRGRKFAMSDRTRERLDTFWELVDEILNSILFVLMGLELLAVKLTGMYLLAGAIAIPVALFSRFLSIGAPAVLLKFKGLGPDSLKIMTWGGLRGGIALALALSLPREYERPVILAMTYSIVVFSIVVQGLTIKRMFRRGGIA